MPRVWNRASRKNQKFKLTHYPQLRKVIAEADSVMALWIELRCEFEEAYRRDPRDEKTIAAIYSYADWCLRAPRQPDPRHDPSTAVTIGFHEEIPTIPAARDDMPRWFSYPEVANNRPVFGYLIEEHELESLLRYMEKNRHRYQPRPPIAE